MGTRLRRSQEADFCVRRRKTGKGYSFIDSEGEPIRDADERQRLLDLAIPPAWTDVQICCHANGHVQARGRDGAGRLQYIYHPDWETRRSAHKLERLKALAGLLGDLRAAVTEDLSAPKGSKKLALALAVALIDDTAMRIGRERYLNENGTRGAATLLKKDVQVRGDTIRIAFVAKGGKKAAYSFKDELLARALKRILDVPGRRLLVFRNEEGDVRPIRSEAINAYLRDICGTEVSAKDIRLLHASAIAGETLAQTEPAKSESGRNRQIARAAKQVSEILHNTPAISRKSYIAAPILTSFAKGKLHRLWPKRGTSRSGLTREEHHLRRFLEEIG